MFQDQQGGYGGWSRVRKWTVTKTRSDRKERRLVQMALGQGSRKFGVS